MAILNHEKALVVNPEHKSLRQSTEIQILKLMSGIHFMAWKKPLALGGTLSRQRTKTPGCRVGIPYFVSATERTITNFIRAPSPSYPVPNSNCVSHETGDQSPLSSLDWDTKTTNKNSTSKFMKCKSPIIYSTFNSQTLSKTSRKQELTLTWIITTLINTNLSPPQPPKTLKVLQLAELIYISLLKL